MNLNDEEPTEVGKNKYPETNGYVNISENYNVPCTCNEMCDSSCDGRICMCLACKANFVL